MVAATKANGKRIICTAGVSTPGKMVVAMRANTLMTANTASVFTPGKTTANTRATGSTVSSTARASTDRLMGKRDAADGKKESVSHG